MALATLLKGASPTPEDEELLRKQARLAELEAELAERELELASFLGELVHFEKQYLHSVGRRYAVLDDVKAKIAEARARRDPKNRQTREQADQARKQAEESARAAGQHAADPQLPDDDAPPRPRQSDSLRDLYRKAARLIHPDTTLDPDEKAKRHRLMGELNDAYKRGDEDRIRAILRDWHASPDNVSGDGPGAELIRLIRKIAQVEKRLQAIAAELDQLKQGELFKLKQAGEEARAEGRDLLKELGERIDEEIAEAREELGRARKEGKR